MSIIIAAIEDQLESSDNLVLTFVTQHMGGQKKLDNNMSYNEIDLTNQSEKQYERKLFTNMSNTLMTCQKEETMGKTTKIEEGELDIFMLIKPKNLNNVDINDVESEDVLASIQMSNTQPAYENNKINLECLEENNTAMLPEQVIPSLGKQLSSEEVSIIKSESKLPNIL